MPELIYKPEEFMRRFARAGERVQIFSAALILKPEAIEISEGVRVDDYSRIEGGRGVKLGRYVHIASFASILGGGEAEMGDFSGMGQGARLITGSGYPFEFEDILPRVIAPDHPVFRSKGRIVMERFSFVAVNAVVLPDVTIGEGAVVGAGSVVTKDVPPWTLVAGFPARVVRKLKVWELRP